ncbi:MAG: DUF5682 family protein [Propionicimonas sp.]
MTDPLGPPGAVPGGTPPPALRVLGVRHHGPGSARAVVRALEAQDPQLVLIEGPPEANALVEWAGRGLVPPVALLAYDQAAPRRAGFWPFAEFSPEWQAISWAVQHGREVRFCDLPAVHTLALEAEEEEPEDEEGPESETDPSSDSEPGADDETLRQALFLAPLARRSSRLLPSRRWERRGGRRLGSLEGDNADQADDFDEPQLRTDPIAVLARTAGYDDPERWWEDVIEARTDGDPFDALTEAMAELRAADIRPVSEQAKLTEARREAAMRQALRKATKAADRVAVVCGAWHAPALSGKLPPATADTALLRGLPKVKVTTAWVPWTHSRLALASGYGAGVDSPGWYHHLFTSSDAVIERWMTAVAQVLRNHDLAVSSAHAIEATRLAQALAAMRGRPLPGLQEVQEAALAVLCEGREQTLGWVTRDLVVGERLGEVPAEAPMVPLEADLRRLAKSARLPFSAEAKDLVLDLRKDTDRAKSMLLRRLRILGIGWGDPMAVGGTGTFKEGWRLAWEPEFALAIVLASRFGTTVESAASAAIVADLGNLADITGRIESALAAELGDTLPELLGILDERAAHTADIAHLLDALPALVRAQRYGDVRGTDTSSLGTVAEAILARACAGLPAASSGLSEEAAAELRRHVDAVQLVIGLMGEASRDLWLDALGRLIDTGDVPGLLAGRATRLLFNADVLSPEDASGRVSQALSHGPSVADRAAFAEGYLAGGALLLVHDEHLMPIIDDWIGGLTGDDFLETLPALRRAFAAYSKPERRQLSERISRGGPTVKVAEEHDWDAAAALLDTVATLLGRNS